MVGELPQVDLEQIQQADIKQTYWLLYQLMKRDFVHKEDLATILDTALVNGGAVATSEGPQPVNGAKIIWIETSAMAEAKAAEYQAKAQSGDAAREAFIEAAEAATMGE